MATVKVTFQEVVESRSGGGNIMTGDAYETRVYVGEFTDATANSIDARNATGVPAYGSAIGSYSLYLQDKTAKPDSKNQAVWWVTCTYRTLNAQMKQPNFNATMNQWNVIKTITPYPVEVPIQKDRSGKLMTNVLNEPIFPSPTIVNYDEQINISFLTTAIDRTTIDATKGKVNSAAVVLAIGGATASYAANTLLFSSPPIQETYDHDGNKIANVNYQLMYRADTWTGKYPNMSFNQSTSTGIQPIYINNDTTQAYVTERQYLTANGSRAAYGATVTIVNSGSGYDYISTASFTTLLSYLATA